MYFSETAVKKANYRIHIFAVDGFNATKKQKTQYGQLTDTYIDEYYLETIVCFAYNGDYNI